MAKYQRRAKARLTARQEAWEELKGLQTGPKTKQLSNGHTYRKPGSMKGRR